MRLVRLAACALTLTSPAAAQVLQGTPVSLPPEVSGAVRVAMLANNRVAVWSTDSAAGVILDQNGGRWHALNARDAGGYAIRRNTTLTSLGDTVAAQDISGSRWVFLPSGGGRGRTAMAPTGPLNENNFPSTQVRPLADGRWLFTPNNDTTPQPVMVGDESGVMMRRIGTFQTSPSARIPVTAPQFGTAVMTVPFAASDRVIVSPTGREVMIVNMTGGRPGDSSTVTINVVRIDGTAVGSSSVRLPIAANAADAATNWKATAFSGFPSNMRPAFEEAAEEALRPFAAYGAFNPSGWFSDNGLWGRVNGAPEGEYLRIDPMSGAQRSVRIPAGCTLLDVTSAAAWWSCTEGTTTRLYSGRM